MLVLTVICVPYLLLGSDCLIYVKFAACPLEAVPRTRLYVALLTTSSACGHHVVGARTLGCSPCLWARQPSAALPPFLSPFLSLSVSLSLTRSLVLSISRSLSLFLAHTLSLSLCLDKKARVVYGVITSRAEGCQDTALCVNSVYPEIVLQA